MTKTFDAISVNLFSLQDFQNASLALNVVDIINSFGDDFIPQVYDYYEPLKRKYNVQESQKIVEIWVNEEANKIAFENNFAGSHLIMKKKKGHQIEYIVSWEKDNTQHFNTLIINIDNSCFRKDQHINILLDLCKKLSSIIKPVFGRISNCAFPDWGEPVNLLTRLPDITWGIIFGEPYTKMFTGDKLLTTPCYKVEELGDNSVFLQITDNIFIKIDDSIKENIKLYLGEDSFVWGGKDYKSYKDGKIPEFDFSNILLDSSQPIIVPKIKTRNL